MNFAAKDYKELSLPANFAAERPPRLNGEEDPNPSTTDAAVSLVELISIGSFNFAEARSIAAFLNEGTVLFADVNDASEGAVVESLSVSWAVLGSAIEPAI